MSSNVPYNFIPGTKAKAEEVNANFSYLNDKISSKLDSDFSNMSEQQRFNFLNKLQISNCVLEAPQPPSYNGSVISLTQGMKFLIPDGLNTNNSFKSFEYTLIEAITLNLTNQTLRDCALFLKKGTYPELVLSPFQFSSTPQKDFYTYVLPENQWYDENCNEICAVIIGVDFNVNNGIIDSGIFMNPAKIVNADLTNISETGKYIINKYADYENIKNVYPTGNISYDTRGYEQILDLYNKSSVTGLDIVKEEDFTTSSGLISSEDSVVRGFSTTEYITTPAISLTDNFEIITPKISYTSSQDYQTILKGFGLELRINSTGKFELHYTISGEDNSFTGNTELSSDKKYLYKIKQTFIDSVYNFYGYCSDDNGETWDLEFSSSDDVSFISSSTDVFYIGSNQSSNYASDSLDMNNFKIYNSDLIVYRACLKIPYKKSASGSKIVSAQYRDRIYDVYEQNGHALYYTIDTANKNFTAPIGEIYGMINGLAEDFEQKVDADMNNCLKPYIVETYRNGSSWYRLYSDGWCEQGGSVYTGGTNNTVTIWFLKPYSHTDYTVVAKRKLNSPEGGGGNTSANGVACRIGTLSTFRHDSCLIQMLGGDSQVWVAFGYIN